MVRCAVSTDLDDILPLVGGCNSGNDFDFYLGVNGSNLESFVAFLSFFRQMLQQSFHLQINRNHLLPDRYVVAVIVLCALLSEGK